MDKMDSSWSKWKTFSSKDSPLELNRINWRESLSVLLGRSIKAKTEPDESSSFSFPVKNSDWIFPTEILPKLSEAYAVQKHLCRAGNHRACIHFRK